MNAQIVFLTLFLGLTSGIQQVDLHVDGPVKVVRIMEDGREIGRMTAPPWNANVDLGPLAPHDLVAIGLDGAGNEIARASQILNLPRPTAEFEIALSNDGKQTFAELRWRHIMNLKPASATMNVDGRPVSLDKDFRAALPALDPLVPHIVSAEMRFEDGFVARKEVVVQGLRSDSVGTQLTPVVVERRAGAPTATRSYDGCFSVLGKPVHVNAVEKPPARVMLVQDPYPGAALRMLWNAINTIGIRAVGNLKPDTSVRITWPIGRGYGDREMRALLFDHSPDVSARAGGMSFFLTRSYGDRTHLTEPLRFADAVAVAGVNSMVGGMRRAVVFVLNDRKDISDWDPAQVRQYLADIGVPLFVWSLSGPRPDLAKTWGPVDDISNPSLLNAATRRLREELDAQRVAWLAIDPLDALHVVVKPECGLEPVMPSASPAAAAPISPNR